MNGVRRFLGGVPATPDKDSGTPLPSLNGTATMPLALGLTRDKPTWPPSEPGSPTKSLPGSPLGSPKTTTAGLFLRKDKQRPPPIPSESDAGAIDGHANGSARPASSTSSAFMSPARGLPGLPSSSYPLSSPSSPEAGPSRFRSPVRSPLAARKTPDYGPSASAAPSRVGTPSRMGPGNVRDELLLSLLASEAVVDSRQCEILSAEDVEELKKELQVLDARRGAMEKKLRLETKIRDAALSLARVNASYKKMSKQTSEQLDAAERKVDAAQKELWRVSERAYDVARRLYEHRAGVLSFSVRTMERKLSPNANGDTTDGSDGTVSRSSMLMSPTLSSVTSVSNQSRRFDGAHLFSGHADAVVPQLPRAPPSVQDIEDIEERLREATKELGEASRRQAEMGRELGMLRLEKEQMGDEVQSREDAIARLEQEVLGLGETGERVEELMREREVWERERRELDESRRQVDILERRLEVLEEQSGEAGEMGNALARAQEENERLRREWEQDRIAWQKETEGGKDMLRDIIRAHGVLVVGDSNLPTLVASLGTHLDDVLAKAENHARAQAEWDTTRQKLQNDIQTGFDKRESLLRDLEEARQDRDEARTQARDFEVRLKEQFDRVNELSTQNGILTPISETSGDVSKLIATLMPLWNQLPSPEARAATMGQRMPPTPTTPKTPGTQGLSLKSKKPSLSDLDVRSLKTLYNSPTGLPRSPMGGPFTVEAFAKRVESLIADDKGLVERLVRFAQAHDLLKKNAERAQKLAMESNQALETYQKQVKLLEERNLTSMERQAALEDEIAQLQDAVDRIEADKRDVESLAAEQAEQIEQLAETNNTLSAQTLSLAEEVQMAGDGVRKQMEAQLVECRANLKRAEVEIEDMRTSDQMQRIQLLDEMTTLQEENEKLRGQLRTRK